MKNERLQKIVNMAKKGTENEKKNAILILKNLCEKYDLVFEELMENENLEEFKFEYKGIVPKKVAFQIYFKIINSGTVSYNPYYIYLKTTKEKFIEFENAMNIYARAYKIERRNLAQRHKQEKKIFQDAFIQRHELFGDETNMTDDEKEERKKRAEKLTKKDIEDMARASRMASEMEEEVCLHKRLN